MAASRVVWWIHARYDLRHDGLWQLRKPTATFVTTSPDDETSNVNATSWVFSFPCYIVDASRFEFDLPDIRREIDWRFVVD